ncbi:unnamed protein product [Candida verbasci]|uniref:Tom7-domain-containing protein n=1 Tax=Candida verbasci TaxID=1227364 RepID=A0A9W4U067_9ASCO|nr:unnamed protein product [Candida verbasci]
MAKESSASSSNSITKYQFTLSDESKERILKVLDYSKTIAHYGFIPFVLYLGWSATSNKPSILSLLSPFPSA